jgi:alpha-galactosidase
VFVVLLCPRVTAQQVLDNLDFIAKNTPGLRYVQIDDGYQPAMGDCSKRRCVRRQRSRRAQTDSRPRLRTAIWVAPFVAEEKSNVFQQHPDWFVKTVTANRCDRSCDFWRLASWSMVRAGRHAPASPAAFRKSLSHDEARVGCTYFKLDANFWGAIHGGHFHDPRATRIEAYRRGMKAILRGVEDSFVLGCNHPIWPSLGLIHGSRSSNDIKRTWERIATTARQNLSRNWQNGNLWWNDSDAVVLRVICLTTSFSFTHGNLRLGRNDLVRRRSHEYQRAETQDAAQATTANRVAARFDDDTFRVGRIDLWRKRQVVSVLNGKIRRKRFRFVWIVRSRLRTSGLTHPWNTHGSNHRRDARAFRTPVDLRMNFVFCALYLVLCWPLIGSLTKNKEQSSKHQ